MREAIHIPALCTALETDAGLLVRWDADRGTISVLPRELCVFRFAIVLFPSLGLSVLFLAPSSLWDTHKPIVRRHGCKERGRRGG